MTHLSPFSYPQRLSIIITAFCAMLVLHSVFQYNYIHHAVHKRDLKFYCTTLLFVHTTTWIIYDTVTTINTYYLSNVTGLGVASPETSLHVRYFCDGILDLTFMSHSALLFLLISFWHTLFSAETAEKFVSKWEFKVYVGYSFISAALYPSLQWPLLPLEDARLEVVVPQLWYCTELALSSVLFLTVIFRMKRFARIQRTGFGKKGGRTISMIDVLCKLVIGLIICNLCQSFSLATINIIYIAYPTVQEAHAAITLGVWDFLTGLYSICYLSFIIIVTLTLNVGSIVRLLQNSGAVVLSSSDGEERSSPINTSSPSSVPIKVLTT
eukprot:TRINITY_DN4000_c0_g1_i2.p1 TRINITY_DN4000_c0_g1~~TRINITY_DN4000_c0_g1_i2.p1  ORF type:complete len:325 (-),score=27.61 TRINITY_DN4000_c0_g1_i2:108-1082(-)